MKDDGLALNDEHEWLDDSLAPYHVKERRRSNSITNEFVKNYAAQYIKEVRNRSSVFFLHVSKTAGSTICECGKANGCTAPPKNCHAEYDKWMWQGGERPDLSCEQMESLMMTNNWTLEGDENYLPREGTCPQFWNVIALRNPIDRIISHLDMLQDPFHHWARQKWAEFSRTFASVNEHLGILVHNYYIRSLVGEFNPDVNITEKHLQKAKQILNSFDVVLVLSQSFNSRLGLTLGWHCQGFHERNNEKKSAVEQNWKAQWSEEEWNQLYEQNKLDFMLKAHADRLVALDDRIFNHPHFQLPEPGQCGHLGL